VLIGGAEHQRGPSLVTRRWLVLLVTSLDLVLQLASIVQ
jgi:hypothetical protein